MFEKLFKKLKSRRGNSLAEFARDYSYDGNTRYNSAPKFGQMDMVLKRRRLSLTSIRL